MVKGPVYTFLLVYVAIHCRCGLTSRQIGPGMLSEFGVIVVCSGQARGMADRGPGRSPHRTWDFAARGR